MARRSSSFFDELVEAGEALPWWLGLVLAFAAFLIFHAFTMMQNPLLRVAGLILQLLVPIAISIGVLARLVKDAGEAGNQEVKNEKGGTGLGTLLISDRDRELLQNETKAKEWSLDLLRNIEWKRLEEVVAEYFRIRGYKAETTPLGKDGGVDVIVYGKETQQPVSLVQCKAWNTYKVKLNEVRELLGAVAAHKVKQGIFITTSTFTEDARQFGKENGLILLDGEELFNEIKGLNEEGERRLLEFATEGDYWVPSCPNCGIKMKERKNRISGRKFWGCSKFPRCRGIIKIGKNDASY